MHQHAGLGRVGQQHDALARGHGPSQPVVGVAKHGHPILRRQHVDTGQLRPHGGQFGALFVGAAAQQRQLALALKAVESLLRGRLQFGIGHGHRLLRHLQSVAQRGVVQRKQRLARLHRLVGPHVNGLDHPLQRRRHRLGIQRNHFRRSQCRLAHRNAQHRQDCQPQQSALCAAQPTPGQRLAQLACQHLPAIAPALPQLGQGAHLGIGGWLVQQKHRPTQPLARTASQRQGEHPGGPPFAPAVQHAIRRAVRLRRHGHPARVCRCTRPQPRPRAAQPHQVGTVFRRPRQPRHGQQPGRVTAALKHQGLPEPQQPIGIVGDGETQLCHCGGSTGSRLYRRHQGGQWRMGQRRNRCLRHAHLKRAVPVIPASSSAGLPSMRPSSSTVWATASTRALRAVTLAE